MTPDQTEHYDHSVDLAEQATGKFFAYEPSASALLRYVWTGNGLRLEICGQIPKRAGVWVATQLNEDLVRQTYPEGPPPLPNADALQARRARRGAAIAALLRVKGG
jgi:hypothetical protein